MNLVKPLLDCFEVRRVKDGSMFAVQINLLKKTK